MNGDDHAGSGHHAAEAPRSAQRKIAAFMPLKRQGKANAEWITGRERVGLCRHFLTTYRTARIELNIGFKPRSSASAAILKRVLLHPNAAPATRLRHSMIPMILFVLIVLFALVVSGVMPAFMKWVWLRCFRRTQPQSLPSILSLVGFALATASGLLAVSSVLYAHAIGGFPYYDPRLLRIYGWGVLLSVSGFAFGINGVQRPGPLCWLAPACSVVTLVFWLLSAAGE